MKKQICNGLLMLGIALMLQGCGQAEEPKERVESGESIESAESISENKTEEEVIRKGSSITWNGLQMDLKSVDGTNFAFEPISESEGIKGKITSDKVELKEDIITVESCEITEEDYLSWFKENLSGWEEFEIYHVTFENSDTHYYYAKTDYEDSDIWALVFHQNESYLVMLDNQGGYGYFLMKSDEKDIVPYIMGENEKCEFQTTLICRQNMYDYVSEYQISDGVDRYTGTFIDKKNNNSFSFEEIMDEVDYQMPRKLWWDDEADNCFGRNLVIKITLNGKKELKIIEETVYMFACNYGFYLDDCNDDGYVDIRIWVYELDHRHAENYYLWDPEEEDFIRFPGSLKEYTSDLLDNGNLERRVPTVHYFKEYVSESHDQDGNLIQKFRLWRWNEYQLYVCAEIEILYNDEEEKDIYQIRCLGKDGEVTVEKEMILEGDDRYFIDLFDMAAEGVFP